MLIKIEDVALKNFVLVGQTETTYHYSYAPNQRVIVATIGKPLKDYIGQYAQVHLEYVPSANYANEKAKEFPISWLMTDILDMYIISMPKAQIGTLYDVLNGIVTVDN